MTFESIDAWWWPFAFILIAGWLATDVWRWLGVVLGNRIEETAEILIYVRAIATALVAAVIAQLVLYPSGALADTPAILRFFAAFAGFMVYIAVGQRIWLGVATALIILVVGL